MEWSGSLFGSCRSWLSHAWPPLWSNKISSAPFQNLLHPVPAQDPEFQSLSSGALMPSPAPAYAEASAAGGRLAPAAPPATEPAPHPIFLAPDPPKIRVIVRKRPLNRKVCWVGEVFHLSGRGPLLRAPLWEVRRPSRGLASHTLARAAGGRPWRYRRLGVRHAALHALCERAQAKGGPHKVYRTAHFSVRVWGSRGWTENRSCRDLGWVRVYLGGV